MQSYAKYTKMFDVAQHANNIRGNAYNMSTNMEVLCKTQTEKKIMFKANKNPMQIT